jgi:citrate lyase subunit beta/citryl-CoA lyase
MTRKATTGNAGQKVRSDCEVTLELKKSGGIKIDLTSKVKTLYGRSIEELCHKMLDFYTVSDCHITLTDSGALPFVIEARLEAAVRRVTGTDLEFLPHMIDRNKYSTTKDRFRFTRLYLPGNTPGLMINAGLHHPDAIILDLEDSVAPDKKDESRILVRNALRQIDFMGAERMVRINQGTRGLEDLDYIIPHNVNLVLIPKCQSADEVIAVENRIAAIRKGEKGVNPVWLMPIIESALGIENCFAISNASENIVAIAIGLEDFTADIGVVRTSDGFESLYARTRLVNAARAAGIQPIDSVFSDVSDMDGLLRNVLTSKSLGFEGMGCIHPRQIAVINKGFSPGEEDIKKAQRIFMAFEEAKARGLGVVALGTKMVDKPVVNKALRTLELAVRLGILEEDWNENIQPDLLAE